MIADIWKAEHLEQLTPEEQDEFVLQRDWVLGSSYLKKKRHRLRRRGDKVRRTMWEPEQLTARDLRRQSLDD